MGINLHGDCVHSAMTVRVLRRILSWWGNSNKVIDVEGMCKHVVWGHATQKIFLNARSEIESGALWRYFFTHFKVPHPRKF